MDFTGYMSCELKLDTKATGWHKTMTKVLKSVKGVSYSIDTQAGIAYVRGKINPDSLLKMLAKAGKHAELLRVYSGKHHQYASARGGQIGYGYYQDPYLYGNGYHQNFYGAPLMEHCHPQSHHYSYYEPTAPPVQGFPQPPPPMDISPFYNPDAQCSIM
ncbi:heavy metal-associated isoprenylated plant protein 32 [Ziziphus jujuba]|uniref:Heavy metal-associated isoprenylated plant protein 32 n=1 Tax=Ziziphus jujuba TaxID=326968 RepID=A0A6P3YS15_ZIZJJ|nr:heavy metal-associated isoprenylated plant protein 32 [Ziziphus jujuba]